MTKVINVLMIGVMLVIYDPINALSDSELLLQQFKPYIESPSTDLEKQLREILKSREGRELIRRIVEIYKRRAFVPKFTERSKVADVVDSRNQMFFSREELDRTLTSGEIAYLSFRDRNLKRKIRFRLGTDAEYLYEEHAIVYRFLPKDGLVINKDGQIKSVSSSEDMSLFHELLHLYHFLSDPVSVYALERYKITKATGYKCKYINKMKLNITIDQSWIDLLGDGVSSVPYFQGADGLVKIFISTGNNEDFVVNVEELFTIRGKLGTLYDISENSYRVSKGKELRYSHIDNLKIEGGSYSSLYGEYYSQAKGR